MFAERKPRSPQPAPSRRWSVGGNCGQQKEAQVSATWAPPRASHPPQCFTQHFCLSMQELRGRRDQDRHYKVFSIRASKQVSNLQPVSGRIALINRQRQNADALPANQSSTETGQRGKLLKQDTPVSCSHHFRLCLRVQMCAWETERAELL